MEEERASMQYGYCETAQKKRIVEINEYSSIRKQNAWLNERIISLTAIKALKPFLDVFFCFALFMPLFCFYERADLVF